MQHIARINEFFVEGKNQQSSHVLLHITEPTTNEEKKRGYFFALCEIENGDLELIEHAQRLIDDIESGYYETENDQNGKSPFELTLEFINRRSNHLLNSKGKLHCIVGVLQDSSISLSYHGGPHAHVFFVQKDTIQDIDILAGGEHDSEEHLFSAVIEGNINEGDRLFMGTPYITEELSLERIQEVIMSRPIDEAVEHIDRVLQDARKDESFGGIICDIIKQDAAANTSTSNSAASLQHLIDRERETTETLSPSLFGGKKKKGKKPVAKRQQKKRNAIETNHKRRGDEIIGGSFVNILLVGIGRGLVAVSVNIWKILRFIAISLSRFFILLFILITNKNNGRAHTLRSIKEGWLDIKSGITRLSFVSKILLLGVIALSIIFAGSFFVLRIQESNKQKEAVYLQQVQAIEDKKAAAEARRIYNDDSGAFNLLKEAEGMLSSLPRENNTQIEEFQGLSTLIETALLNLRDITVVEPTLIADLGSGNERVSATKLVRIDDSLVAFGPEDNRIYMVDKDTGNISIQSHNSLEHLTAGNTPKENDMIAFVGQQNEIFLYDKETKTLSNTDITYPSENVNVTAPFVYNLRLYLVDKANNQILRHSKIQGGYDKGTPWLDEGVSVDLSDAISLAIDGDIFVLKQNGEILKFVGGEQEVFEITGLDPSLENPTEFYTYNDVDGIYITEPTNKRIIALNKQGTFRAQYTSDLWHNPTDMVVDEAKSIIYVLDMNRIYSFNF
jgi:hypothetical protein